MAMLGQLESTLRRPRTMLRISIQIKLDTRLGQILLKCKYLLSFKPRQRLDETALSQFVVAPN
jgi:hypothetical protein